jgi:hypothetical protein
VTPAPAPRAVVVPSVEPADPATIAKAREALRQKLEELPAPPPESAPHPVVATPAPVQPAASPAPAVTPPPTPPPATLSPATVAKAREAERLKTQQPSAQPPASVPPRKTKGLDFPPLQGPPLPISAEKDQRLQVLLQKYKADQITPEEYHAARAKILAEP